LNKSRETLVLIPAYKEEKYLLGVIKNINFKNMQILLVWDIPNKKDLKILLSYNFPNLRIIVRNSRSGVGSAIMEGINYALKHKYDNLIVMAGNGKDDPKEIPKFLNLLNSGKVDYIQGSRWISGGLSENLPNLRRVIIKILALCWSVILGKRITEVTNGFRGFNVGIFQNYRIKWNLVAFAGYELEYYLNYAIIHEGYRHKEVGVSKKYVPNVVHSKIKLRDAFQILGPLVQTPIFHYIYNRQKS